MKYLFISDLHIGSIKAWGVRKRLFRFLESERPERLFILGDAVEWFTENRLPDDWFGFNAHLKRLAIPIFVVIGNHDYGAASAFRELGYTVVENPFGCVLKLKGKSGFFQAAILHGHAYDRYCVQPLGFFNRGIIQANQRINKTLGIDLEKKLRETLRLSFDRHREMADIKKAAIADRLKREVRYIIMGHTHSPEIDGGAGYINTGDCVTNCTGVRYDGEAFSLVDF